MQMKIVGRKTPTGPPTVQCSIPGYSRSLPAFNIAICHLPREILSLVSCQQITIRQEGGLIPLAGSMTGALSGTKSLQEMQIPRISRRVVLQDNPKKVKEGIPSLFSALQMASRLYRPIQQPSQVGS
ncbi:uncharacterized protein BDW47DRAFT_113567 [Aspergillus candidus]|uniref:Uncharacterized protein n=1 Tax=Aspergillus candidus TaxID=41067 RepID=A0A2I2EZ53_ASPCN|nr:hypothetical protein BDW47DRAFT_113567 [Aspergillus candidus]PLB33642.1 hypothetical protein BDW47DRAFT_113567 [Aspergillus candidus]